MIIHELRFWGGNGETESQATMLRAAELMEELLVDNIEDLLADVSFHLSQSTDDTLRKLGERAEAILHTSAVPSDDGVSR